MLEQNGLKNNIDTNNMIKSVMKSLNIELDEPTQKIVSDNTAQMISIINQEMKSFLDTVSSEEKISDEKTKNQIENFAIKIAPKIAANIESMIKKIDNN